MIENEPGQYKLSGKLTRDKVPALTPFKNGVSHVVMDISELTHVDTAGIAWFVHVSSVCEKQDATLTLLHPSEQLQSLAEVSGISVLLSLAE